MKKSNVVLRSAIVLLERKGRRERAGIWRDAARALGAGKATRTQVNVGRLARLAAESSAFLVPGKVLGAGSLDAKKIVVGAFSFSRSAREKIEASGGEALNFVDFVKKFPDGSRVTLVRK